MKLVIGRQCALPPPTMAPGSGTGPLTSAQRRMWLACALDQSKVAYLIPIVLRVTGRLNIGVLRRALSLLLAEQPTLRAKIARQAEGVGQIVDAIGTFSAVELVDAPTDSLAGALAMAFAMYPADPETCAAYRAAAFRVDSNSCYLAFRFHHVFVDGHSLRIFARSLRMYYAELLASGAAEACSPRLSTRDQALWERDIVAPRLRPLAVTPNCGGPVAPVELPFDISQPSDVEPPIRVRKRVGTSVHQAIVTLASSEGVSPVVVWLAALVTFLASTTSADDITVSTLGSGRFRKELSDAIGCFVRPIFVRVFGISGCSFRELLAKVYDVYLDAYGQQDLLDEEDQPTRASGVLLYRDAADEASWSLPEVSIDHVPIERAVARSDLQVSVRAEATDSELKFEYTPRGFSRAYAEALTDSFLASTADAVGDPDTVRFPTSDCGDTGFVWSAPTASGDSHARRGGLMTDYPVDADAHSHPFLLADGGGAVPDAVFARHSTLLKFAGRLARVLAEHGVEAGSVVALRVPQGRDYLAAVLAVLLCGATFAPLDPEWPEPYCRDPLRATAARCCVVQTSVGESFAGVDCLRLADLIRRMESARSLDRTHAVRDDSPACVLFTSGSTGHAKAVIITHRNLRNRFEWMWRRYPFTDGDVCLQKTNPVFVDSLWELLGGVLRGVPTVLTSPAARTDVALLTELIDRYQVSRLTTIPSVLELLLESCGNRSDAAASLRLCISSGEVLRPQLVRRFFEVLPHARLLNLYGSTETTGDATYFECRPADVTRSAVPVGSAIANTVVRVCDWRGRPTPVGVVGTIVVTGAAVAAGYGRAGRFDHYPSAFRTGDLGRLLPDGVIEYVGRSSDLRKISGVRVSLSHVEHVLAAIPAVRRVVVVCDETDGAADPVLRACCEVRGEVGEDELRRLAAQALPASFRPRTYHIATALPTTSTGKPDRAAVLALLAEPPTTGGPAVAARPNPTEAGHPAGTDRLYSIISDAFGGHPVGSHDDLLAQGATSLILMKIAAACTATFGRTVTFADIVRNPRISALVEFIGLGSDE